MTTLPQLLAVVIPLAIAAMISPLAIITVMTVLSSAEHRLKKGAIFVATYCIVFSLICLVFLALGSLTTTGGKPSLTTVAIDFILGLLLLYASARSLLKKQGSKTFDATAMGSGALVSMGFAFGFGNIFSSLPALAASKDIGVVVLSVHDKAIAFFLDHGHSALLVLGATRHLCRDAPKFRPHLRSHHPFLEETRQSADCRRVLHRRHLPYRAWRDVGNDVVVVDRTALAAMGHALEQAEEDVILAIELQGSSTSKSDIFPVSRIGVVNVYSKR